MSKKYKYRTTFIGEDGIRHDIKADSSAELIDKLTQVKRDIEEGYTPIKASSITVSKWLDKCFDEYKTDVTEQTLRGYKSKAGKWIIPAIGHLRVKDVKPLDCQAVMNSMQGLAADTIRKVKQILYFCFDRACENRIIRENPAARVTMPKGHKSTHRSITEHERSILLMTVEKRLNGQYVAPAGRYKLSKSDARYKYVYFLFMLYCGCRPSEAAEIQARDITNVNGKYKLHIRGTKTANADRFVPIPDYLVERLPRTSSPFEYLFANASGNKMNEASRQALWRSFKRDLNITAGCRVYRNALVPPYPIANDFVPYCLRHTYCTDLQKAGVDIRTAQYLMGHATIEITADIYTHQDESTIQNAAEKLDNYYSSSMPILETNVETMPQTIANA